VSIRLARTALPPGCSPLVGGREFHDVAASELYGSSNFAGLPLKVVMLDAWLASLLQLAGLAEDPRHAAAESGGVPTLVRRRGVRAAAANAPRRRTGRHPSEPRRRARRSERCLLCSLSEPHRVVAKRAEPASHHHLQAAAAHNAHATPAHRASPSMRESQSGTLLGAGRRRDALTFSPAWEWPR
jgi:hypothetical protein